VKTKLLLLIVNKNLKMAENNNIRICIYINFLGGIKCQTERNQ